MCLEAQQPPNAVNVDAFPDVILRPGEIYSAVTGPFASALRCSGVVDWLVGWLG